jgi:hypothetical protein
MTDTAGGAGRKAPPPDAKDMPAPADKMIRRPTTKSARR